MPLQKSEISLNLSGKLDTKSESKLVPMDGVLVSENIEYSKIGTIKKCDGLEAVSTTLYLPLNDINTTINTSRPIKFISDFNKLSLLRSPSNLGGSVYSQNESKWISTNRLYGSVNGDTNFSQHSTPNYKEKIIDAGDRLGFRYNDIVYSSKFDFYIASGEIKDIDGSSKTYIYKLDSNYNIIYKSVIGVLPSPNTCARIYIDDSDNSIANCKIVVYIIYSTQLHTIKYDINFVKITNFAYNFNCSVGLMVSKINTYNNFMYLLFQTTDYKFYILRFDSTGYNITYSNLITPVGGTTIAVASTKHDFTFTSDKVFIFFMEDYTLPANGGNLYMRAISLDHNLVTLNNSYRLSSIGNLSGVNEISCCEDLGNLGRIQIVVSNVRLNTLGEYSAKFTNSTTKTYLFIDFFYFNSSDNSIIRNLSGGITDLITSFTMIGELVCFLINGSSKFFFIAHTGCLGEANTLFNMEATDFLIEFELVSTIIYRSNISPVARYNIDNGIGFNTSPTIPTVVKDRLIKNGNKLITNSLYFSKTLLNGDVVTSDFGSRTFGMKVIEFDFSEDINKSVQKLGNQVIISGAIPTIYDGFSYYIQGFVLKPFVLDVQVTPSPTGFFTVLGNYNLKIIASYININGEIEYSRISNNVLITITERADIYIYTMPQTLSMKSLSAINVYMTAANGTIYTLKNSFDKSLGYTYNATSPFKFKVGFAGTYVAPVAIPIYTQSGELENDPLPPSKFLISANDRMFSVNANDNNISYSKVYLQDAALNFSAFLFKSIQAENGILSVDINSMGLLDGRVILFKENSIYGFSGDGPSNDGNNDSFTTPQKISVEVGCSEPKSLVSTPLGLMFKSLKGIYVLDRGFNTKYVGAEVEAYNSEVITSSTLNQNKNQVIFMTSSDKSLVYDYLIDRWTVYKGYNGQDSIIFDDKLYLLKNYNIFKQSSSDFRVNSANNQMKITTSWYKVSGIENFGRVYRALLLGKFKSAHNLIVKTYYDYDENLFETFTIKPLITDNIYQYQVNFSRQKCQAVKFEIYDVSTAGSYEGLELTDISLVVGKKVGLNKISDRKAYKGV